MKYKKLKTKANPEGRDWPDEIVLDVGSNMPMDVYAMHNLSDFGVLYIRHDVVEKRIKILQEQLDHHEDMGKELDLLD